MIGGPRDIYPAMRPMRMIVVLALTAGLGLSASTARGEGLPTVCLRLIGLPLLQCPAAAPAGSGEPRPAVVNSTNVQYDPRLIIVSFKRRTRRSAINAAFARAGVRLVRSLAKEKEGLYAVRAPDGRRDSALASLRGEHSITRAQKEVLVGASDTIPDDPQWPDQWGLRQAGFPKAWDVTRGSSKVVIAVLDTGVDGSHPDLNGALVPGRDIVNGDTDTSDDNGHGTAVAGVLAARGNNSLGIAGACWACLVMPVKVLGKDGTGTTEDVAAGIVWAADHGARVINLSLGAPGTTEAMSEAVDYAASKDVVIVAAAGNAASASPFYPAADGAVIGVAATNPADQLYSWSNHGAWVQVAAPGCNDAPWPHGGYVAFCGTSAAAPLVAGLAALIRSARPDATATETVKAVYQAVDRVNAEVQRGRINAGAAIATPAAARRTTTTTERGTLGGWIRSRTHKLTTAAGELVAVLRFSGARRLTLLLYRPHLQVVRVSGRSPLRLRRQVGAGPLALVVKSARARASYSLTLSYGAP